MANNNDFIQVVARLNETKSASIIKIQLNEIQKKLQLQLSDVKITSAGQKALQDSINAIQNNLKVNISGVSIDQNKMVQGAQQVAKQISSTMSTSLNRVDTSGLTRATEQIQSLKDALDNSGSPKAFTDLDELQNFVRNALPQFENIKVAINSWYEGTETVTGQVKSFTAEILNGDKAVEKLSFRLKGLKDDKTDTQWVFGNASATDNAIKVREQAIKLQEQLEKEAIKLQEQLEKQASKSYNATIKLKSGLQGVKEKFSETLQTHEGDNNLTKYLNKANKALAMLNSADGKNFDRLKIKAQNAIAKYTDYLTKLKSADTEAEQSQRRLTSEISSGYKTLVHYNQMMNNLSQRQVFNKNASSPNVVGWQSDITTQNEEFKKLKATIESGVATPEVLNQIKTLSSAINDVILKGHEMARTLGQSTSNVNAEAELNNLKTLMNNLKASDVEVEKLRADYGELIGLFVQAEDTGDFSQFFNRLTVFKSKFAEAKSEVRATNAEIADLASMAKQLQSNKLTNFFSRNAGDVRVTGLKTEIAGLIIEWDALNNEIAQTGQITPSTQAKIDSLRTRMEQTTVAADQLQKSIKEDAQAIRLMTQKQSLSTRIQTWLQNNTRASEETRAKLMALQAQIQSADAQQMTNLNNQLRQITSSATAAGEAGMKLGDLIRQKLAKFAGWFSIATVVMRTVRYIKEMATTVRELDTAMTSLRKVTKETEREYNDFFVVATKNAKELGASIKDIIDSTAEFARLGYGLKDASILSEVATLYKNVGDGIDIGEATTSIISTMKGFGVQSSEVETQIVDKFNKVGGRNLPMRNYIG